MLYIIKTEYDLAIITKIMTICSVTYGSYKPLSSNVTERNPIYIEYDKKSNLYYQLDTPADADQAVSCTELIKWYLNKNGISTRQGAKLAIAPTNSQKAAWLIKAREQDIYSLSGWITSIVDNHCTTTDT
jgi:hypothetical protein